MRLGADTSVPHFDNLQRVFLNAFKSLRAGGKFSISHSRTREGLKEHHRRIGYISEKEPIPTDETLYQLSKEYESIRMCQRWHIH